MPATAISDAKLAANRANAAKSTGPRTPVGIDKSKYNRLRHGLNSPLTVLPFENQDDYNNLYAGFLEQYSPVGPTEEALVKQLTDSAWKTQRLDKLEAHVFELLTTSPDDAAADDPLTAIAANLVANANGRSTLNLLARYTATLQRQFHQALNQLRKIQHDRKQAEESAARREVILNMTGIGENSEATLNAIDLIASDPTAIGRYIDAEANLFIARKAA